MKLTKEQRVYVAVLGLAVGGFAVDRVFLSDPVTGPAGAAAGEAAPADASALVVDPALRARAAATQAGASSNIAERLDALRGQAAAPDAMASALTVPPSWFEARPDPASPNAPAKTEKPAPTLQEQYKLTAVAAGKVGGYATVNKQKVRLGQEIDGMTLVELKGRQAIFERGSEKIVLEMVVATREQKTDPKTEQKTEPKPDPKPDQNPQENQ